MKYLWAGPYVFLAFIVASAGYIWLGPAAWLHSELFSVSEYVWLPTNSSSIGGQLSAMLNRHLFDIIPARFRPLSDMAEIFDAMTRPRMLWLFGMHPSLTIISVILAISLPYVFFVFLRRIGLSHEESLVFAGFLITTIGFLSCFVPYIRPAKKIALFGACTTIYLILRARERPGVRWTILLAANSFVLLFSDEAGFSYWIVAIASVSFGKQSKHKRYQIISMATIPIAYFLFVGFIVPVVYGPNDTVGSLDTNSALTTSLHIAGRVFSTSYYEIAFNDLGRGTALSIGLSMVSPVAVAIVLIVGLLLTMIMWIRDRKSSAFSVFLSIGSLIVVSMFLTLIDGFNSVDSPNWLGRLTYYYHSPIAIFSVGVLASIYNVAKPHLKTIHKWFLFIFICFVSVLNLTNFKRVNEIFEIIHLYPLNNAILAQDLTYIRSTPRRIGPLHLNGSDLTCRFKVLMNELRQEEASALNTMMAHYYAQPMGGVEYATRFAKVFWPIDTTTFSPIIASEPPCSRS